MVTLQAHDKVTPTQRSFDFIVYSYIPTLLNDQSPTLGEILERVAATINWFDPPENEQLGTGSASARTSAPLHRYRH